MKKIKFALVLVVTLLVVSMLSTSAFALEPVPEVEVPEVESMPEVEVPEVESMQELILPVECPSVTIDSCKSDEGVSVQSESDEGVDQPKREMEPEKPARREKDTKAEKPQVSRQRREREESVTKPINTRVSIEEALSYVESNVRMEGILQLHFFGRMVNYDTLCLEVFVPEIYETFTAEVVVTSMDEYVIKTVDLKRIVEEINIVWNCAPVDFYDAVDYVDERLRGIYSEAVYGNVSREGDDVYFDFCIVKENGAMELYFVEPYASCEGEYFTTYASLERLCTLLERSNFND